MWPRDPNGGVTGCSIATKLKQTDGPPFLAHFKCPEISARRVICEEGLALVETVREISDLFTLDMFLMVDPQFLTREEIEVCWLKNQKRTFSIAVVSPTLDKC